MTFRRNANRWPYAPPAFSTQKKRAKPRKLEDPIHILCLNWLQVNFDGIVYHCPNGMDAGNEVIFIHGKPVSRAAIMWKKLVKLGARPGVLDLTLHWSPGRTAYFEIKSEEGSLSDNQEIFMGDLDKCGIPHRLCRSLADCQRAAVELQLPMKRFGLSRE